MSFKSEANKISAKQGVSKKAADAIPAAGAKKASPAARKANPIIGKVMGNSGKKPSK